MNRYVVTYPTRGVQTVLVEAETAAEAQRLAKVQRPSSRSWHEITWSGRPRARLDELAATHPSKEETVVEP